MSRFKMGLLMAGIALASGGVSAADVEGRLTRRNVFSNTVEGAPRVAVTLSSTVLGRSVIAYTNSSGRYRFRNLAPGQYKLEIWPSGFAREAGSADLITCQFNVSGSRTELRELQLRNSPLGSRPSTRGCEEGIGHWFQ